MIKFEPSIHLTPKVGKRQDLWWKGAIIYQIYPRSFMDSNGDGIGDLPGITSHLGHIAELGADAVWISPFMKSPQADYGYDVADYCDVDPMFGRIEDFDALVERAHDLGLKVMIDFVPSHTSDRHPWFAESRQSRDNNKADWYVWADPKPDGTAPNNWISIFGGPAWQFDTRRHQYYLHNFLREQPDLNFHNPRVIEALMDQAEFWLERGVDGFRVDAIDFGVHDPELRNNPVHPENCGKAGGLNPYAMQYQQWNKARPELAELFFKPLFRLSEKYGAKCLLGEISGETALLRMADYSTGGGLDMAYSFDLLGCRLDEIGEVVGRLEEHIDEGWACWAFSNHDVVRAPTRHGGRNPSDALKKMLPQLLTSLRGTICLYQGEELGLEETDLAFDEIRDPVGIEFWPENKGRDGCRTPIPWSAQAEYGGFSHNQPWLPIGDTNHALAADRQNDDPNSVLNATRAFLHWRKNQPALRTGDIEFLSSPLGSLVFTREAHGQKLYCVFNLTSEDVSIPVPKGLSDAGCPTAKGLLDHNSLQLAAHACFFAQQHR